MICRLSGRHEVASPLVSWATIPKFARQMKEQHCYVAMDPTAEFAESVDYRTALSSFRELVHFALKTKLQ